VTALRGSSYIILAFVYLLPSFPNRPRPRRRSRPRPLVHLAFHARRMRRTRMISIRYGAPEYGAHSGHIALNCLTQGLKPWAESWSPFQGKDLHGFPYVDAHVRRRTRLNASTIRGAAPGLDHRASCRGSRGNASTPSPKLIVKPRGPLRRNPVDTTAQRLQSKLVQLTVILDSSAARWGGQARNGRGGCRDG
jgi:hypothetical protein